ncbi:VapE domain-containing protein [Pseudomonas chlororaphis]|uniref:Virulence-associated e family protein n=1 Tax=Pseudomonas chlororaphis TaxID=587753 RepID=A0AAX3G4K0_9PSED|nr:VapE domain-containing protein [Pseudomonas chlororaphis]AZC37091.1 DNA primase, phage associated [Pseudomonas chlororaphis subsp. piscium]AZC43637.1 DNA primase, phage associated [Pseudomonas chlororaphis subsp. piscium]WDG75501.1 VapE family protein [Pseudomonas chlororaphis]WDH26863.1 VapE family protein [Pseudomonas chlororaphis]WDH74021.1 VapE family protein [Pseudomonas chlororaphis]
MLDEVLGQFADYGLEPKQPLVFGKLTRCKTAQDKGKEKNGWYVIHEHRTEKGETLIFGSFGDWRAGETQKIKVKAGRMTPEEREVMRARQEEAKRRAAEVATNAARRAANRAAGLFRRMPEKGRSAYLDRKQIVGFKVRYAPRTGAVLVPMCNVRDQIVGLQVIYPGPQPETGRDKSYWPYGMAKEGAFHLIGPHPEPGEPVLVCEGYATGTSLHMATSLTVAIAFDAGNLLAVAKAMRERFPGRPLIICRDDDWKTKRPNGEPWNPGEEKANNAATVVGGQVVAPIFSGEREDKWTDFNDLHCAEGLEAVRRQVLAVVKPPAAGGWKDQLARTENGSLIAHMQNVELILGNDERWSGVIGFSAFSSKIVKLRAAPYGGGVGDWADIDDMLVMKWLAQQYNLRVKSTHVIEAVSVVAHDHAFHPVRDYLNGLEWDRVPRLDSWLTDIMGVAPTEYSSKVGKRWMVSAVGRVMKPGCKADSVMILEGAQGAGKSTAMSILGGEWFMDTPFALGDKDGFQAIRGKWIVELGELDSFNKAESTKAKQFFSASTDTYRESYGRRTMDVPRQCVFVGTTNQDEYLKDATGNRRYWPVACTKVELELLRQIRDQLWAEAMFCYLSGDIWWVNRDESPLFAEAQEERFVVDEWEGPILTWLEESQIGETATGTDILSGALKLDFGHWGKPEQMRVGAIMHRLGWRKVRLSALAKSGIRPWAYKKPAGWGRAAALVQEKFEEPCFDD